MLELAFDVVGAEGDGGLAWPDRLQVGVAGAGEAEFFVDLADTVGDGFAGSGGAGSRRGDRHRRVVHREAAPHCVDGGADAG